MHQGGDYASQYYPHHYPAPNPNPSPIPNSNLNPVPNPNPSPIPNPNLNPTPMDFPQPNLIQPPFASAPPYSQYRQSEFPNYSSYSQIPSEPNPIVPPQPQFPHSLPFNPPPFPQEPYFPYDSAPNYAPNPNPNPYPYQSYENPYENSAKFDQGSGYFSDGSLSRYGVGNDDGLGDGVYAYDGGKVEPYGARGIGGFGMNSSSGSRDSELKFDDYGRSLGMSGGSSVNEQKKIVRAVPKMETQQDVKNGVQKYRVKLLPEGASVSTTDVLCQIGLDGIRMLDPSTNRTLRIYPLENVTRWEVLDSNIFAFWSKSPVDIESRRIRLQSNSYTTNTILDTVTAATVQLKEMGGKDNLVRSKGNADASKPSDEATEKKKGFADWMNLIKPGNEEKDHWVPDEAVSKCTSCATDFGAFVRRHHCRNCGDIFCDKCTQGRIALTADEQAQPVRVCDRCMAEVSQRLSNAKESASKSVAIHSHEELARKLQEEMEKNRKLSSGSKSSDGSGRRMREVACPICTVHLQVQVPTSGSETIECGVCQHPFLVSAH